MQADSSGEPAAPQSAPSGLLRVGVAIVIGAVAANVLGFRYSRWAVGKELHRAWERQSASRSAREGPSGASSRAARDARGTTASRSSTAGRDESHPSSSPSSRMFEEFMRRAEAAAGDSRAREAARQARGAGGDSRASRQSWERTWSAGGASGTRRHTVQFDFDPASVEELLHILRGRGRGGASAGFRRVVSGFDVRDIQELLRAARDAQAASRAQSGRSSASEFDEEFWEQVFGSGAGSGRQGGGGTGSSHQRSSSRGDPFGGSAFGSASRDSALATLGLARGATDAEVKRAYRLQAMRFHPDTYRGPDPEGAARQFREVTAAYKTLCA
jgi:DnaJ-domain-containing protein 1